MHFKGFSHPNYTPVPDELFDELLADLGHAELKALLYIIRRTFGFKKDADSISFSQFLTGITTKDGIVLDRGCGIKKASNLSTALKSLEEKGIIVTTKGDDAAGDKSTTIYSLHFAEGVLPQKEYPTPVEGVPVLPQKDSQETVNKNLPYKKNKKKTITEDEREAAYARLAAEQADRLAVFLKADHTGEE